MNEYIYEMIKTNNDLVKRNNELIEKYIKETRIIQIQLIGIGTLVIGLIMTITKI